MGIPLALLGIGLAYFQVIKTRKASEAAERSVKTFRNDLNQTLCLSDLTKALTGIEELKRLFRNKMYTALPDRLSDVRHTLIAVRGTHINLSEDEQVIFQDAISDLSNLESKIEEFNLNGGQIKTLTRSKDLLTGRTDKLHEIMSRLKNQIGEKSDDTTK